MLRVAKTLKYKNYAEKRKIISADEEAKKPKHEGTQSVNFQVVDFLGDIESDSVSEPLVENFEDNNHQRDSDVQLQNHQNDSAQISNGEPKQLDEKEKKGGYPILNIADDIKKYAQKFIIPYKQIDGLLEVLRPYHPTLPVSSKTLMGRYFQKKHDVEVFPDGGEFVYFGISDHLKATVNPKLHKNQILKLQFNFDGIPLFKSSSRTFWPILGKIYTSDNVYEPFVIGVYSGTGKPKCVCKYLEKFVRELNSLLENGIEIECQQWTVEVMCFICDTQARAYIKCCQGVTGKHSCERCTVVGYKVGKTTVFPVGQNQPRTDESFRLKLDPEHHNIDAFSPLINIFPHIDMIYLFILDFMHLGCLGTTKKLLTEYWMKPSKNILNRQQIMCLSQRLMNLSSQLPCEFQRTTRSLGEVAKWKATEFRFFLLYAGPLVLKGILPDLHYKHFLLFSVGSRILCSKKHYETHFDEAESYLQKFAQLASHEDLYGLKVLVNNTHNTFHLPDDVKNMGCPLSDISAFCFENLLGRMKKILQSGNRPLAELQNKLHDFCPDKKPDKPLEFVAYPSASQKHAKEGAVNLFKVQYKDSTLTGKAPNNVVQLVTGEVMLIQKMTSTDATLKSIDSISLEGQELKIVGPAFEYPGDSSILNIHKVQKVAQAPSKQFTLREVDSKMMLFEIFEVEEDEPERYVMPLLHMN
ncbi:hypothetical protein QAD02_017210 [Eretmocerus hayati]|uniref:Uncharacterized protein n=3 Tax=Eretmocerus hayati TaxID=131215 RepID=A0ACC2NNI1_9HYME|nr:hypothetical protein QAD02_003926 [Eretmocerus hayati]KAJ8674804.1 hypothetical protein QAD02_010590 [Eretmocerus hayati]KAJ8681423.1 hypothetical protein QAD02_017210 [Eretmocerus hayati]